MNTLGFRGPGEARTWHRRGHQNLGKFLWRMHLGESIPKYQVQVCEPLALRGQATGRQDERTDWYVNQLWNLTWKFGHSMI